MLRSAPYLVLTIAAATALGCSLSQEMPEKRRFLLRAERPGDPAPRCDARLTVGRVRVAPLYERQGLVFLRDEGDVATSFFDEFERPPGVMLREATLAWLRDAGLFAEVLEPGDLPPTDWILRGRVRKLYADVRRSDAPSAVLEIDFSVLDARTSEAVLARSYGQAAPARSEQAHAVVASWEQALAAILNGLESDLRELLAARDRCG